MPLHPVVGVEGAIAAVAEGAGVGAAAPVTVGAVLAEAVAAGAAVAVAAVGAEEVGGGSTALVAVKK
jgi:hypothetical protein